MAIGLFSFVDELRDTAKDVITETPKAIAEKAPELAAFVENASLTAVQKIIKNIGELAAKKWG